MTKKPKKIAWHKRRGKMLSSKYAKVHHGTPPPSNVKREEAGIKDSPTMRLMRNIAQEAKKAVRKSNR